MNEFKTYHPVVNFVYFLLVICFSAVFMHPALISVSFVCAAVYSALIKGKINIVHILPLTAAAALINPAFNHEGVTILWYFPSGNPLTLESVIYGLSAAGMLAGVILWFSCYNEVMTNDKFIYLFGRIIPSLSLVLSITLRFIPEFAAHIKKTADAQKCIGTDISEGSLIKRARCCICILSVMITWSLENAIETADSMKSRGYGLNGRTAFSIFVFDKRDAAALICIGALGICIIGGIICKKTAFLYFPSVQAAEMSLGAAGVFAAYFLLCAAPIIIETSEVIRWKYIRSKT